MKSGVSKGVLVLTNLVGSHSSHATATDNKDFSHVMYMLIV